MLEQITRLHEEFCRQCKLADKHTSIPSDDTHKRAIAVHYKKFKCDIAMTVLLKSGNEYSKDIAYMISNHNLG